MTEMKNTKTLCRTLGMRKVFSPGFTKALRPTALARWTRLKEKQVAPKPGVDTIAVTDVHVNASVCVGVNFC